VPAGLGVYWITNNLVSMGISLAVKENFKRNPMVIDVDVNPEDLGYDPSVTAVLYEDLLKEAELNPKPSRSRKRGAPVARHSQMQEGQGLQAQGGELVKAPLVEKREEEKAGVQ
jgi:membrane protein insertase Oxa1/YidC/SpoIIIJ